MVVPVHSSPMEDVEVLVTDLIHYLNAKLFVGNSNEKHS